jgi:cyclase
MTFRSALLLLTSFLVPVAQGPPPPPVTVDKIADDFYVVRGGGAGNTSVYITDEGLILVDPKYERNNADLIASVTALSSQPIKYVFNTHAHADHTGGNARLAPALIVGHVNQRELMLKGNLPGAPQVTYSAELHLTLGDKETVARYWGRCHTSGDSFIYFPARRVLATGDCYTRGTPFSTSPPTSTGIFVNYADGGSLEEAIKTVGEALKLDFDTVVPGHGPLVTKADLVQWHERLQRLRNRVSTLLREGKGRDAVVDVLVKEFEWDADTVNTKGTPFSTGARADALINELKP